ncbi:hypothetical protein NIES2101_39240 [Calothrix sp. HK-06]|nr:hypothetical protein NIES2101_39240 [Calothrix sp. HK-06]
MLKATGARRRLLISSILFLITCILLPRWMRLPTRSIIAWDASVTCFLTLAWSKMSNTNPQAIRRNAQIQDNSRLTIMIIIIAAACASLLAIGFILNNNKDKNIPLELIVLHVTLAVFTIVVSWLLTHTMFALHYAHLYYRDYEENPDQKQNNGLDFPEEKQPDYWDFMYFSFIIGMTCQVSDVQITSRSMRRLALTHGILTFFFNTVILALSINIIAGII